MLIYKAALAVVQYLIQTEITVVLTVAAAGTFVGIPEAMISQYVMHLVELHGMLIVLVNLEILLVTVLMDYIRL